MADNAAITGNSHVTLPKNWYLNARLKFKHLQLLVALDEHRNLKRGASTVGLSQPAASKLLGDLESELKEDLFRRHSKGVEPTLYGEALIRKARTILNELSQAGEQLNALHAGASGTIAVGTVTGPAVEIIAPAVERVMRANPRLQISIHVETSEFLAKALLNSALDFALARMPTRIDAQAFVYEEIGDERISIVCRSNHPLARKRSVSVDELRTYPWIMQPRGAPLRSCIEHLFLSHKLTLPDSIIETASVLMTMALVEKTTSLAVIADSVAALYSLPDRFASLSISTPLSLEPFGLIQLRDRHLSPAVKILQEEVRTLARNRTKKKRARKG